MCHTTVQGQNLGLGSVKVMVCNPTFNNIFVISWRSVLLVEETRVPGETQVTVVVFNSTFNNISVISWRSVLLGEVPEDNHRPDKLYQFSYNVVSSKPHHERQ